MGTRTSGQCRPSWKSLGLWQFISAFVIAACVSLWSRLIHLKGPEILVLALGAFASCLTLIVFIPEVLRPQLKVRLTPIPGPSPVQLLTVENRGAPVTVRAQCTLLNRRNDPNPLLRSQFRLEWDAPKKRAVILHHGGICNLVVAKAGVIQGEIQEHYARPPEPDQKWIRIWGLSSEGEGCSGEAKESSMWYYGDKRPEYDLEITIVGENHKPYVSVSR
jgi:hypothetical protein